MKKLQSWFMLFIFFAALIPAALPDSASAQAELTEVTIIPDGAGGYDTYISSANPYNNYGSDTAMLIGKTSADEIGRGLVNFDLSTLPLDAEVVSASLTLTVSEDLAANASTLEMYPVLAPWVESGAWWLRYRECQPSCWWTTPQWSDPWQVAGASGAADITDELVGSVAVANDLAQGTKVTITVDPIFAGNLIRGNYQGFLMKTSAEVNDAYKFYTSDALDEGNRPALTLEYDPSPEVQDQGWFCIAGLMDCEPYMTTGVSTTPFLVAEPGGFAIPNTYGGGPWDGYDTSIAVGGLIDCEPYPQCRNDYPIYYRVVYNFEWESSYQETVWATINLRVSGSGLVIEQHTPICYADEGSNNTIGHCKGVMIGIIQPEQIQDVGSLGMDVYVKTHMVFSTGYPVESDMTLDVYFSREAPVETCSDTYVVTVPYNFDIDPTIETPAGMVGDETPVDEQGYPLTIDEMYMLKLEGVWNDGAADRSDAAVSLDGIAYMPLVEFIFSENILCYDISFVNPDLITVYFTATTEAIYIRANDIAGETPSVFPDNTIPNELTPFTYTIGVAFTSDPACPQFSYSEEDVIKTINIPSTDDDVPVYDAQMEQVVGGEWYGVKVTSGTWHENDPVTERIDMEFGFIVFGPQQYPPPWADLANGSALVNCVSSDSTMVFIQAPITQGLVLHLRVNDQDDPQNWSDNTGTLIVKVYHVTNTYIPTGCATDFRLNDLVASGEVQADQSNGHGFGNSFGSLDGFGITSPGGVSTSYYMTLGGWYMLQTRDGPWTASSASGGEYIDGQDYYDIQIRRWSTDFDDTWHDPDEWALATCVVPIDMLGHQRIYFRVPDNALGDENDGGTEYMLRVAGTSNSTEGFIGWDLYQAINDETSGTDNPWESCLAGYGVFNYLNQAWIPVKAEEGASITQNVPVGGGATLLTAGDMYYLKTNNGPWNDAENPEPRYNAQLSSDGGTTWYSISEHPDVECGVVDQLGKYETAIFSVSVGQVWKIRVADTASAIFTDNEGSLSYQLKNAQVGTDDDGGNDSGIYDDADFDVCQPSLIRPTFDNPETVEPTEVVVPTPPVEGDVVDWLVYLGSWVGNSVDWYAGLFNTTKTNTVAWYISFANYIGGWVPYTTRSISTYFAWCPRHTNALIVEFYKLREKEPLATIYELETAADTTIAEVKSYDWGPGGEGGGIAGEDYEDTSIFSFGGEGGGGDGSPETVNNIIEKIFPSYGPSNDVWDGGDLVNFSEMGGAMPAYYETCNVLFGDFLPSRLRMGVCFASTWWKETGAAWWIQLSLDISTVFALFLMIKSSAQSLIYMMTGVRPWTKDGARKIIVETVRGSNK